MRFFTTTILVLAGLLTAPTVIQPSTDGSMAHDLTMTSVGHTALLVFFIAYLVVMAEEFTHLRKSKPVILAAGVIWGMSACCSSPLWLIFWCRLLSCTLPSPPAIHQARRNRSRCAGAANASCSCLPPPS